MIRRGAATVLAAVLVAVTLVTTGGWAPANVTLAAAQASALPPDVPADAPYSAGVAWALDEGVLALFGDGTFRPQATLSRTELAVALWQLAGRPTDAPVAALIDVPAGAHPLAIDWAVDRRIITPNASGAFRPTRATRRSALGLALWRWAGSPEGAPAHPFSDVPQGAAYQAAFDWLVDRGIVIARSDGRLRPTRQVTRAQVAMALYRQVLAHQGDPPNLVVILTDDQTLESMRVMPQVQHLLADEGTTFANAFATFPLCCPSRATLLTGQYSHNTRVRNNILPLGGHATLDHTNALPTWLHDRGYATAHVGKYLNCYGSTHRSCGTAGPDVPPGWDDWFGLPDPYPVPYSYFSFDAFDNGTLRHFGPADDVYQTDVLAHRAVADIRRLAERTQPFFVNVWPQAPHAGGGPTAPNGFSPAPSPAYAGTLSTEALPDSPSFGEPDVSDKPAYVRGWFAEHWAGGSERYGLTRAYRATLESLRSVDDLVGDVVGALQDTGELDHTVILFTSDNGLMFGEHRMKFWKVVPYEESVHVPLIVRGPGFPVGATADQMVGNIDIAPTLVALSGATAGRTMDGRALLPLAQNPSVAARRAILLEDWPEGTSRVVPHYAAVRVPGQVYVEYDNGDRELYDVTTDPYELASLHGDPAWAARRATLAAALARLRNCAGASCEVSVPAG